MYVCVLFFKGYTNYIHIMHLVLFFILPQILKIIPHTMYRDVLLVFKGCFTLHMIVFRKLFYLGYLGGIKNSSVNEVRTVRTIVHTNCTYKL